MLYTNSGSHFHNTFYFKLTSADVRGQCDTLTPMSPQMLSYWNWNHSWSEWGTVIHAPNISLAYNQQPETLQSDTGREDDRKGLGIISMRERQGQADRETDQQQRVEWLEFHIGEKPLHWMPYELSKRRDQTCFSISPWIEPNLSAKRESGKTTFQAIHLTLSLDHPEFRTVNLQLTPPHSEGVSS